MKVKDLMKQLEKLPPDSNISMNWDDFHIWIKYYAYEEDIKTWCWSIENQLDFFLENRELFPEKVRFIFEKNDRYYYKYKKK